MLVHAFLLLANEVLWDIFCSSQLCLQYNLDPGRYNRQAKEDGLLNFGTSNLADPVVVLFVWIKFVKGKTLAFD